MNWRTSCVFCLFSIILLLTTSCSSINFIASGRTPFKISANAKSEQTSTIEGSSDFYFWGRSPGKVDIDLEDQSNLLGLNLPSYVSVEQTTGWKSFFYTVVTLGLYCPVDYTIVVRTAKEEL